MSRADKETMDVKDDRQFLIARLEGDLAAYRDHRDKEEKAGLRSAYNEVCDRLDVLLSKLHHRDCIEREMNANH